MVIYVRLRQEEMGIVERALFEMNEKTKKINELTQAFSAVLNEKKKRSVGIITKIRELKKETRKIKETLPKLETWEEKPKVGKKTKISRYSKELEEIKKKIETLEK